MSACSRRDFLKGSHAGDRDPGDMVSSRAAGCFNQERREVHLSTRSSRPGRDTTESFACWNSRPRCTAKVGQAPGSTGSTTAARRPDRALRHAGSLPPAPLPRTSELSRSCRLGSECNQYHRRAISEWIAHSHLVHISTVIHTS